MAPRQKDTTSKSQPEIDAARREIERLKRENAELRRQLASSLPPRQVELPARKPIAAEPAAAERSESVPILLPGTSPLTQVTGDSPPAEKIRLFRTLFRGRDDVYAVRWVSAHTGKKGYSPARKDPWGSDRKAPQIYLPLTDDVIREHLEGRKVVGVYPLLVDHTCWWLACDFDKGGWMLDSLAFLAACARHRVPAYLERSRSGNGGHVWLFFAEPISATSARQLGTRLLWEAMSERGDMDLASYDRLFPNQDFVPRGGFGNLIALPLQGEAREKSHTEFLNHRDPDLTPWPDQWAFLSGVERIGTARLAELLETIPAIAVGPEAAIRHPQGSGQRVPAPAEIPCTFGATLTLARSGLPPWLLSQIKHLASLHNPLFYERQKLRLSTYRTPQFIKCYDEDLAHLRLPRGILSGLTKVVADAGSRLVLTDQRPTVGPLDLEFQGSLTPIQAKALEAVLPHELGVLVAPPGSGKTVIGCAAVARRNLPTLILAHRKPILEQWRTQLMALLGLPSKKIGQVGGGRNRRSGVVDLGMLQSLKSQPDLDSFFSSYGFVIVDECHVVPAFTFEACLKRASVRYFLGLTATPYRRDGLHDIIVMQCGPIRHRMESSGTGLALRLCVRETALAYGGGEDTSIQDVFRAVIGDAARNALILQDIRQALDEGRRCLVLSQWRQHCRALADGLTAAGEHPFVLDGSLGKKERRTMLERIVEAGPQDRLVVVATGQYLGEGFDCPPLDTLFLAFPVSFKGKLVQYVGRLLRAYPGKDDILVYDYTDPGVPVLRNMAAKRRKTYDQLGFVENIKGERELFEAER